MNLRQWVQFSASATTLPFAIAAAVVEGRFDSLGSNRIVREFGPHREAPALRSLRRKRMGLRFFYPGSVKSSEIRKGAGYGGVQFDPQANLDDASI